MDGSGGGVLSLDVEEPHLLTQGVERRVFVAAHFLTMSQNAEHSDNVSPNNCSLARIMAERYLRGPA